MDNLKDNFSKIYDEYVERIYRFIFLKTNSKEVAQDISSDTFLKCWQSVKRGKDIENKQAFLYQIARNLVIDYYRKKGRAQFVSVEDVPLTDPNVNLAKSAAISSDMDMIKTALQKLNSDYQDVIIWHYIDDLSVSEISKTLSKSEGTVRVLLSRALESLRKELPDVKQV